MNFTLEILNTSWIFDDYDFDLPPPSPSTQTPPPLPQFTPTTYETPTNTTALSVVGVQWFWLSVVKSVILAILVLLTIGGNVLILLAVLLTRSLRSSTHYLVVNLAVADLLLGTTVLPFSATLEVSGRWYFGQVFCEVWATADVLCCTASIWSLCVISLDRYIGVTRPLAYSTIMTEKRMGMLIAGVWALSIVISIGPAFGWKTPPDPDPTVCTVNQELGYVLFSVTGSFYLPTLVILGVYFRIYREAVKQSRFLESGVKTTKTAVTLRVHRGGVKATRGVGIAAGMAAGLATGLGGINGHCIGPLASDSGASEPHEPPHETKGIARLMLPMLPHAPLFPETRRSIRRSFRRGKDGGHDSPSGSPERRLPSGGGKVAKFRRQKKAAKTLGIVVGAFLLCWFPFFFILPLDSLCSQCHISETLFATFFWLGYFNSCLNPFIYACTSKDFKRAFERILCRKRRRTLNHAQFNSAVWRRGTTLSTAGRTPSPARHGIEGLLANSIPLADTCAALWKTTPPSRSPRSPRDCQFDTSVLN